MQSKMNAKRARAVAVTIALIVATNFAISRAESAPQSDPISSNSYAADATIFQPAPRPSGSFAADATIFQPAPRPSGSFAADATIFQPAPRPS